MENVDLDEPDVGAACVAAILGPAIATALVALVLTIAGGLLALGIALVVFITALVVAALHVGLLGIPLYLLVRRIVVPGWRVAGGCGIALGAGPFLLIAAASGERLGDDVSTALFLGVMGLIGGLSFQWKLCS